MDDLDLTWNRLSLDAGVILDFSGTGSVSARMVTGLIVNSSGTIVNVSAPAGFTLLYDSALAPGLSGIYILPGGGALSPISPSNAVPVPAAVFLELVGLLGLVGVRRRLKAS